MPRPPFPCWPALARSAFFPRPCIPAAVTLMVLGISLALGVAAYSRPDVSGLSLIGYSRQPHEPGAFLSRMRFGGACGGATAIWPFQSSPPSRSSSPYCSLPS
eukprot:7181735-Prymnesium_polylepis.1